MVIKSQIFNLIRRYLGEYLYGFSKEHLEIGILSGELEMINLNFRPHKINQVLSSKKIPFCLKVGMIGKTTVRFNYNSLFSNPISIYLNEIFLIFGPILNAGIETSIKNEIYSTNENLYEMSSPQKETNWKNQNIQIKSLKLLTSSPENFLSSHLKSLLSKLNIDIQSVHIRFEDETYSYMHPYSMTLLLQKFQLTSSAFQYVFSDSAEFTEKKAASLNSSQKKGQIEGLSFYVTSMSSMIIPASLWEETQSAKFGIFSALPAYEIRNLVLQETEILKSSPGLVSEISIRFSVSVFKDLPWLRVNGLVNRMKFNVSSVTAECFRNLLEYTQNAKVWEDLRKFRPGQKIITKNRLENEPAHLKKMRLKVVLAWFQYAFKFIKIRNGKNVTSDCQDAKPQFENDYLKKDPEKKSIFELKTRKIPGMASSTVKQLIKDYNKKISVEEVQKIKEKAQTYIEKPESYLLKLLENTEFNVKFEEISLVFYENDLNSYCENLVKGFFGTLRLLPDEFIVYLAVDLIKTELTNNDKKITLIHLGKSEENIKALGLTGAYRPSQNEFIIGKFPDSNLIEIESSVNEVDISYSHYSLIEILAIIESFRTYKVFREINDIDYMKNIELKTGKLTEKEKFIKKNRQIIHQGVFKKIIMAKKLIRRLLQWQAKIKEGVKDLDNTLKPVLFNVKVETLGISIKMLDKEMREKSIITLPSGICEFLKDKENTKIEIFGFGVVSKVPFRNLYKHLIKFTKNLKQKLKKPKNKSK